MMSVYSFLIPVAIGLVAAAAGAVLLFLGLRGRSRAGGAAQPPSRAALVYLFVGALLLMGGLGTVCAGLVVILTTMM